MTKEQAKIILKMIKECEKNEKERGGPEHNSYYAIIETLEIWKEKAKKSIEKIG